MLEANAMVAVVVEGVVLFYSRSKKDSQENLGDNIPNWLAVGVVGIVESKFVEDTKGVYQLVDIETVAMVP